MKRKPTLLIRYILVQFVALCFSANLFAQQVNISFENAPIKTILKEITSQTGYNFVYSDALKSLDKRINVSYSSTNQPIDNLLKKVFEGTDIIYSIKDKQIALLNSEIKQGSSRTTTQQPTPENANTVTGTVRDNSNIKP